jgi:phospholipid transport system substrate-binding protein
MRSVASVSLRWRIASLVLLGVLVPPASVAASAKPDAQQVIQSFQDTLISVMKAAKSLGYRGRYDKLAPEVEASLDLPFIARVAVGQYWDPLAEQQQALLVKTFTELSIATYASRFDDYSGEKFQMGGEQPLRRGDVLVQSVLVKANGDKVHFDYQMRKSGDTWRIINIVVDGVSDLALKRAEYTSILQDKGFDALIAKLKDKIVQYEKGTAK